MTGLHTGHAWIRGNGDIPLRPEDVTIAEVLRAAGYRTAVIGNPGFGTPGTPAMPDRQGFDHASGFHHHRHAHRQYTDHLWRNGERASHRSRARLRQRPFYERDDGVHQAQRRSPVFRLPQLHRSARRAARARRLDERGARPFSRETF